MQDDRPAAQPGEPLSKDATTMAMLAHLLAIFTGFIGPLIIYLIKKEEHRFIAFHSLQAVFFELLAIPFTLITCGLGGIVVIIFNIIACVKASSGEWYKYPLAGNWAESQR